MGREKLTTREFRIRKRTAQRKIKLKQAAVIGFKRPADFPKIDHKTGEKIEE